MIVSKDIMKISVLSLISFLLLMVVYVYAVEVYHSTGIILNSSYDIVIPRVSFSLLLLTSSIYMFSNRENEPINIVLYIVYLFYFLPLLAYFCLSDMLWYSFLCCSLAYIVIVYSVKFFHNYRLKPVFLLNKDVLETRIILVLICVEIAVILHAFSISHDYVISFANVYVYRGAYGEAINHGIWGYLSSSVISTVSPFLGLHSLSKRKYKLYLFILFLDLLMFMSSGHKASLFYFFLEVGVYLAMNKKIAIGYLFNLYSLLLIYTSVLVFSIFIIVFNLNIWVVALLNRAFFTPVKLYDEYFTYILSGSGKLTYQTISANFNGISIPHIIGIYDGSNAAANTGYVASAYILGGFLWVCLYTFVFCMLMILANVLLKSVGT